MIGNKLRRLAKLSCKKTFYLFFCAEKTFSKTYVQLSYLKVIFLPPYFTRVAVY